MPDQDRSVQPTPEPCRWHTPKALDDGTLYAVQSFGNLSLQAVAGNGDGRSSFGRFHICARCGVVFSMAVVEENEGSTMPDRSLADKRKLAGELVEYLNGLAAIDPAAVLALAEHHVPCNQAMAYDHPTVQVRAYQDGDADPYWVGLLGILNGFVGTDDRGQGLIQRIVDDEDPKAIAFRVAPE